ncbi:MAG: hypothetical protein CFE24_05500 [Flavobacterium sp. BFFFF2]|nr:MAG: hypothetical protein CFE24_05500 [Flavobacterium sp. BFFFF2]
MKDGGTARKKKKFEVRIFKSANSYKKEVVNIDVTGKEIINCRLFANNHNMLQAVGFYSSVRDNGKANKELKGLYVATIDLKTNTVLTTKFNEFDYATKVKLLGERRANKGKDLKPLYTIHSIIERADGGLVVMSEFSTLYIGKKQGIGPLGFQPMTYTRNEIIVNAMSADGTLEWSGVVPKEQVVTVTGLSLNFGAFAGGGAGGGSFSVGVSTSISLGVLGKGPEFISAIPIFHKEKLYVLFNDHVKNVGITNIEDIRTMSNPNKAVPTLFVFDQKGNMVRKDLEVAAKEELSIRTAVFYRKNSNEFIIYSSRRSVDKIGRMFIND